MSRFSPIPDEIKIAESISLPDPIFNAFPKKNLLISWTNVKGLIDVNLITTKGKKYNFVIKESYDGFMNDLKEVLMCPDRADVYYAFNVDEWSIIINDKQEKCKTKHINKMFSYSMY